MNRRSNPHSSRASKESVYRNSIKSDGHSGNDGPRPPILPTFEPADFPGGPDYWDLRNEVAHLKRYVELHVPADTELRALFTLALPKESIDEKRLPSRAGLQRALDAFLALPDAERRCILNGWTYAPRDRTADRLQLQTDLEAGSLVVGAEILADTRPGSTVDRAWHTAASTGDAFDVRLFITRGTSKVNALRILRELAGFIDRQWPAIASDAWEGGGR